jgi:mono/diheme cytochrome c family protein
MMGRVATTTSEEKRVKVKRQRSDNRGLRRTRVLAFSVFCMFAILIACISLLAEENSSAGEAVFKRKCVLCHGADGSGNTPLGKQLQAANLGSKEVQKLTVAEMRKQVHDGRANMPAFGDQLSDEEVTQVIQYVRQFGKVKKKK